MKQKIRTFVAARISAAVRKAAAELACRLAAAGADVKWVEPETMHLTLKFIGDVDAREVHEVCRAVTRAAEPLAPFELEFRGAGAFPNVRRPRTVWLGTGEGGPEVAALAERVEAELADLGFPREHRPFHAHLTLGRVRRAGAGMARLGELVTEQADFSAGRARVNETVVFSSTLQRDGPRYDVLGRAALKGN